MAKNESITLPAEMVEKLYGHLSSINIMLVGIHDLALRTDCEGAVAVCVENLAKVCARKVDFVVTAITQGPGFGNFEAEFAELSNRQGQ